MRRAKPRAAAASVVAENRVAVAAQVAVLVEVGDAEAARGARAHAGAQAVELGIALAPEAARVPLDGKARDGRHHAAAARSRGKRRTASADF
jgi:hypothetical protein